MSGQIDFKVIGPSLHVRVGINAEGFIALGCDRCGWRRTLSSSSLPATAVLVEALRHNVESPCEGERS